MEQLRTLSLFKIRINVVVERLMTALRKPPFPLAEHSACASPRLPGLLPKIMLHIPGPIDHHEKAARRIDDWHRGGQASHSICTISDMHFEPDQLFAGHSRGRMVQPESLEAFRNLMMDMWWRRALPNGDAAAWLGGFLTADLLLQFRQAWVAGILLIGTAFRGRGKQCTDSHYVQS